MPDIAMCNGSGCPKKQQCYRFTATPSEFLQSYFKDPPVKSDGSCVYFIPNHKLTIDEDD